VINRHFEQHQKIAPQKKKKKNTKLHVSGTWHVKGKWAGIKI
jgi:hypothetical protein